MGKEIHPFSDVTNLEFECKTCLDDPRGQLIGVQYKDSVAMWVFNKCESCGQGKKTGVMYDIDTYLKEVKLLDIINLEKE